MINEIHAKRFCSEDISLIENYHQAVSDQNRTWDVHHRRECDSEGRTLFTKKQLIEMNLYENRPASELIFVTRSMHWKLHRELYINRAKIRGKSGGTTTKTKYSKPILQFSKDGEFIREFTSVCEAERKLSIPTTNICKCLKGIRKHAGGFVWKYKN